MLINHDGRVVLSDFGVTANLERATPSSLRVDSHAQASTSDAAGAIFLPSALHARSRILSTFIDAQSRSSCAHNQHICSRAVVDISSCKDRQMRWCEKTNEVVAQVSVYLPVLQ